jgi:hypothetical protein
VSRLGLAWCLGYDGFLSAGDLRLFQGTSGVPGPGGAVLGGSEAIYVISDSWVCVAVVVK